MIPSLFLCRPVDFAMLWSFCVSRPLGYLDIAWSQSPVSQMISDLTDPADKTLHGKRKWQTAGDTGPDYQGSLKRDWSQQLFKLRKAAKNVNILLGPFLTPNLYWLKLVWTSLAKARLLIWGRKVPVSKGLQLCSDNKKKNGKEHILKNKCVKWYKMNKLINATKQCIDVKYTSLNTEWVRFAGIGQTCQSFYYAGKLQKGDWGASLCFEQQLLGGPLVVSPPGGIKKTYTYSTNIPTCWNRVDSNSVETQPPPRIPFSSIHENIFFHKAITFHSSHNEIIISNFWKNKLVLAHVWVITSWKSLNKYRKSSTIQYKLLIQILLSQIHEPHDYLATPTDSSITACCFILTHI